MNSSILPSRPTVRLLQAGFSLLTGLLALALFNFQVDRWGVYHSNYINFADHGQPNAFYLKSRYLLEETGRKDCLVLGSSRVEVLDMQQFPANCYNFSHPFGSPTKNLRILEGLVAAAKAPSIVYMGLDDASYTISDSDTHASRPVPKNGWEALQFHASYLLRSPSWVDLDILSGRINRIDIPWVALDPQLQQEALRDSAAGYFADPQAHEKGHSQRWATIWSNADAVDTTLQVAKELVDLTQTAGIELRFFFSPMHYKTYLKIDHEKFNRFRRGMARLAPYMDFTGLRETTLDNRYWKETSHYSAFLGDAVAACLTGLGDTLDLPCKQIEEDNIADHVEGNYRTDLAALLTHDKFLGAHFIPAALGKYALARTSDAKNEPLSVGKPTLEYSGIEVFDRGYLHSKGQDPWLRFSGTCFESNAAYILQLELEYREAQLLYLYSPDVDGRYNAVSRDRLGLDAGRHLVYLLIRGLDCSQEVRLDPMQNRGGLFLHNSALYRLKG